MVPHPVTENGNLKSVDLCKSQHEASTFRDFKFSEIASPKNTTLAENANLLSGKKREAKQVEKEIEDEANLKKPMTNKERAQRARMRKKAYTENLENKWKELEEKVHLLTAEVDTYKQKERLGAKASSGEMKTAFDVNVYDQALKVIKNCDPEGKLGIHEYL